MTNHIKVSKYLSYLLRHNPKKENLELDSEGFTNVDILIKKINITKDVLNNIVANDMKGRYEFNQDNTKIRATNGHSIKSVSLKLKALKPPLLVCLLKHLLYLVCCLLIVQPNFHLLANKILYLKLNILLNIH